MPIEGFRDLEGIPVPLSEISPIEDWARFNCSPTTLEMLIEKATVRDGLDFTASMIGDTPRQQLLRSQPYYPTTSQALSGLMGTMRHEKVNIRRNGWLIVEERIVSKRNPRLSGQLDSASVCDIVYDNDNSVITLWVDLWDLKTIKWYSTKLCLQDVEKNHPDYVWQLNLNACLLEELETGEIIHLLGDMLASKGEGWGKFNIRIRVRDLYLECIPPDSSYSHEAEASKVGAIEWQKVIVKVPRKPADDVYAAYETALEMRDAVLADGHAALCADRWSNKTVKDLRCRWYCDVAAECIQMSHDAGESHPIASLEDALEASLKVAQR